MSNNIQDKVSKALAARITTEAVKRIDIGKLVERAVPIIEAEILAGLAGRDTASSIRELMSDSICDSLPFDRISRAIGNELAKGIERAMKAKR